MTGTRQLLTGISDEFEEMFEKGFFELRRGRVPKFEVAEDVSEGGDVWYTEQPRLAVLPVSRFESSRHREAEVQDVRVEQGQLLSEEHGQSLVASVGLHLVPEVEH